MAGHAGLIIKATRLCNLRCTYCHDWATGPGQTMRFPVLARLVKAALEDPDHGAVEFIWHGGEPTILPLDFYRKALYLQSEFRRPGQAVRNVIQSNGTALTADWARFFKTYDFKVGVSIDGPPEIHDRYRRYATGRPSWADVVQGIRMLREHGVAFTVLMVIDEDALAVGPDGIFEFFVDLGAKDFGLLLAHPINQPSAPPGTPAEHYMDPVRMNAFMARLYDRWLEHGDRTVRIRELAGIEARLTGGVPTVCTLAGNCLGTYYLIEPNGDVAHCDLFLGDDRYTLGSVMRHGFPEIRSSLKLAVLKRENTEALEAMKACPEFSVCQGWCPHERYLSARHNPSHTSECCGLRDLIDHIRSRTDGRMSLSNAR